MTVLSDSNDRISIGQLEDNKVVWTEGVSERKQSNQGRVVERVHNWNEMEIIEFLHSREKHRHKQSPPFNGKKDRHRGFYKVWKGRERE